MKKLLVISVGGTPAPVVASIDAQCPDFVAYLTSRKSRKIVREGVEPMLVHRPVDHEIIVTSDEQDLVSTVEAIQGGVARLLKQWGECEIIGDFTGGTKAMSAALVLALSVHGVRFSYVGGDERTKDGLGLVIDGREQTLHLANPWDALAIGALREMEMLFNRCRFRAVVDLAQRTAERTEKHRSFLQAVRLLAEGFYHWDSFQYRTAIPSLRQGYSLLRPYADGSGNRGVKDFCKGVSDCINGIEAIERDTLLFKTNLSSRDRVAAKCADGRAIILDLVANAVRRADTEFKYEDAVARLYSAIEKMAKARLKAAYGLDNSDLAIHLIKDPDLRTRLEAEHKEPGKIQLPLARSFDLLEQLGDPLGFRFSHYWPELRKILDIRNHSLLGHGFNPVGEDTYRNLLLVALAFLEIDEAALPRFPWLALDGLPL